MAKLSHHRQFLHAIIGATALAAPPAHRTGASLSDPAGATRRRHRRRSNARHHRAPHRPGYEATSWSSIAAPSGTPADIVQKLTRRSTRRSPIPASSRDLPILIPAEVWTLDRLPVLGTGKADMVTLEKLVRERIAEKAQAQGEPMARAAG